MENKEKLTKSILSVAKKTKVFCDDLDGIGFENSKASYIYDDITDLLFELWCLPDENMEKEATICHDYWIILIDDYILGKRHLHEVIDGFKNWDKD